MAHQSYLYLKLLLRNNLLLDLDEYALIDTAQDGLVCNFMAMRLASAFQPVVRKSGEIVGREALLRPSLFEHGELAPNSAFEVAIQANRLVLFDRLVRTLHLLNHANGFAEHELLFLNVHPRLLSSVSDHGRTFEQILHYYSVPTSHVVIEVKESAAEDSARLAEAVNNYRSLGYQIAVDDFGATASGIDKIMNRQRSYHSLISGRGYAEVDRVLSLRPDIVKLDSSVIRAAEHVDAAASVIHGLVDIFHGIGAQVAIEGIENAAQLEIARNTGADLLQGYHVAQPEFATRGQLCRSGRIAA